MTGDRDKALSIPFLQDPGAYKRTVERQRDWVQDVAAKIEAGETLELDRIQRGHIANILRLFTTTVRDTPPGKQGKPKFCHGSEALSFASNRSFGLSHSEAIAEIADRVGVSEQAVSKAIKKHLPAAYNLLGTEPPTTKK